MNSRPKMNVHAVTSAEFCSCKRRSSEIGGFWVILIASWNVSFLSVACDKLLLESLMYLFLFLFGGVAWHLSSMGLAGWAPTLDAYNCLFPYNSCWLYAIYTSLIGRLRCCITYLCCSALMLQYFFQFQDGGGKGKTGGKSKFSGGSFYTTVISSLLLFWCSNMLN